MGRAAFAREVRAVLAALRADEAAGPPAAMSAEDVAQFVSSLTYRRGAIAALAWVAGEDDAFGEQWL